MNFLNSTHEARFNALLERDNTRPEDNERKALLFILSGNDRLFNTIDDIYDFKNHHVTLDRFESLRLSSSEEGLLELALNLYNNYSHKEGTMRSTHDLFRVLDDNNFELALSAIRLRYKK